MKGMQRVLHNTRLTLEMIKWEHSIFALPFALSGAVLAAGGWPMAHQLLWIVVCMVAARTAAMAFNRFVDAELDRANPRTASRAIPAGLLSSSFVGGFVVMASAVFIIGAAELNRLTLWLSPIALAVVLLYSYMKRVTRWSHLVLGLALGIAPSAAWIAVRGTLSWRIVLLTVIVLLWVGGFDILYACQDFEHDRRAGLHSVPAALGMRRAFAVARGMHLVMLLLLPVLAWQFGLGPVAWAGYLLIAALVVYEHTLVSPDDLRRMDAAFFTLNGIISVVFFIFTAGAVMAQGRAG